MRWRWPALDTLRRAALNDAVENVKPQRIGFLIGGISIALIVVMMYILTSSETVHPLTPHDVKATIPAAAFTVAPASATAAGATATGGPASGATAATAAP